MKPRIFALTNSVRELWEEVADVINETAIAGGTTIRSAKETFWLGKAGYFRDPNSHLWELDLSPANLSAN
jgi:uncharacterized protein